MKIMKRESIIAHLVSAIRYIEITEKLFGDEGVEMPGLVEIVCTLSDMKVRQSEIIGEEVMKAIGTIGDADIQKMVDENRGLDGSIKKIQTIKRIREVGNLGLKEAKAVLDNYLKNK